MAQFACTNCGHRQSVPEVHLGKSLRCPKCRELGWIVQGDIESEPTAPSSEQNGHKKDVFGEPLVRRSGGGSVQTRLGHNITVNEHSALTREWITIDDEQMPARLVGNVGIRTIYRRDTDYSAGGFEYQANYEVITSDSITAIETRFLTFDVWGEHINTLSGCSILDLALGQKQSFTQSWNVYSENEIAQFYASIAYIAQVRTASGPVFKGNVGAVLQEARQFSAKFEESNLAPSPVKR